DCPGPTRSGARFTENLRFMELIKPLRFPFVGLIKPLQFLPVGLFGSTVAIAGLANALKQGTALFGLPAFLAAYVTAACWVLFLLLLIGYSIKSILYRRKVAEELAHPVTANFLGTFFISAILLAGLSVP